MDAVVWEWVNLLIRWLHVVAGIAWIGSSFYFIHLDASLKRRPGLDEGVAGEAWQVHGGGFYHMQKYLVAPPALPEELKWFKWEAYTTWLSGAALLILVYYLSADIYLVDAAVRDISASTATLVGALSLVAGWLVYDGLCRSPLGRSDGALAAVGFVLLVLAAFGYTQVFSGRGAYIHVGALVGTIMVANVFLVIIPNQTKVVADLRAGRLPAPALGRQAKQRSLHNNYLTLPVVFTMIANHYPATFGSRWNWLILAGVFVVGFLVRHFFNAMHQGRGRQWWLWPAAAAALVPVVYLTLPAAPPSAGGSAGVQFTAVVPIIEARCNQCHARKPTWEGIAEAPKGVVLETAAEIRREARRIFAQTVLSTAMPLGNVTQMTDDERALIGAWVQAGAKVD